MNRQQDWNPESPRFKADELWGTKRLIKSGLMKRHPKMTADQLNSATKRIVDFMAAKKKVLILMEQGLLVTPSLQVRSLISSLPRHFLGAAQLWFKDGKISICMPSGTIETVEAFFHPSLIMSWNNMIKFYKNQVKLWRAHDKAMEDAPATAPAIIPNTAEEESEIDGAINNNEDSTNMASQDIISNPNASSAEMSNTNRSPEKDARSLRRENRNRKKDQPVSQPRDGSQEEDKQDRSEDEEEDTEQDFDMNDILSQQRNYDNSNSSAHQSINQHHMRDEAHRRKEHQRKKRKAHRNSTRRGRERHRDNHRSSGHHHHQQAPLPETQAFSEEESSDSASDPDARSRSRNRNKKKNPHHRKMEQSSRSQSSNRHGRKFSRAPIYDGEEDASDNSAVKFPFTLLGSCRVLALAQNSYILLGKRFIWINDKKNE